MTQTPTKVGTPCANCGKPIGKAMIAYHPYTTVCKGTCLMGLVVADLEDRARRGVPLLDDITCGCCGGPLKVFAKLEDIRAQPWRSLSICDVCSFRRCPKGDKCAARKAA